MLDAMERLDLEDNSPDIEVLEGQMSVEELLAELGLEWRPEPGAGGPEDEAATAESFSQPALF
jgi:hypothetical protein